MTNLHKALNELAILHAKLDLPGSFEPIEDLNSAWPIGLPRSAETDVFFESFNPVDVYYQTGFSPLDFHPVQKIERAQLGYRWIQGRTGREESVNWPAHYLVIMGEGGKPIIADTSEAGTPVYASYDVIEPFKIAESLADFLFALTALTEIIYRKYDVFDIVDDEDNVIPEFYEELQTRVTPILGQENCQRFYDYFYG